MNGAGRRNVRTAQFKKLLGRLPERIQRAADETFRTFLEDPFHPLLRNHELQPTRQGRHRSGTHAVSVTFRYRALYVVDGDTNVWYWIGSHEDYNNFIGSK